MAEILPKRRKTLKTLSNQSINPWRPPYCLCCLFFRPTEDFFHSFGDVIISGEGLQIMTYTRGSLTYNTLCDRGQHFIMVISEEPWQSHLLPSVWQWSCHHLFCPDWGSSPDLPHARRTLYHYAIAAVVLSDKLPNYKRMTAKPRSTAFSCFCLPERTKLHGESWHKMSNFLLSLGNE